MKNSITFVFLSLFCQVSFAQTTVNITGKQTATSYTNSEVYVKDGAELTITSATPLTNSHIYLETANSWVIFQNVRPKVFQTTYRTSVIAGATGTTAVAHGTNARIEPYKHGTVVIKDANNIKPLTAYTAVNYGGTSASYEMYSSGTTPKIHTALGAMDGAIASFKLKRGYMVTFATKSDGLGYSRVIVADNADLEVPNIAAFDPYLNQSISFIRVVKWKYVSKKGWAGAGLSDEQKLQFTWCYDWGGGNGSWGTTNNSGEYLNAEYIPQRHHPGWDSWSNINSRPNSTAVLGANEPENDADHDGTTYSVDQIIAEWPGMLATGLRIGAPATTDGQWNNWLYPFIDKCDALNYRVDFVAVHYYRGGKSATQLYNELKAIHDRTGRPLWLTEWNNGANWTSESWPSGIAAQEAKQLADMTAWFNKMNETPWIERFAVYNNVEQKRNFIRQSTVATGASGTLTPAGEMMRDYNANMAFTHAEEFTPLPWKFKAPSINLTTIVTDSFGIKLNKNPNGNLCLAIIVEQRTSNGTYVPVDTLQPNITNMKLALIPNTSAFYRLRYSTKSGGYSPYTEDVGYFYTSNAAIQKGTIFVSGESWLPVFFGSNFAQAPVTIFGVPSFNNRAEVTLGSRNLAANKMEFRMKIWQYRVNAGGSNSSLTTAEYAPYLLLNSGTYDFGGLKAIAANTTGNGTWKTVTFPTAFNAAPAVFVMPNSANATTATVTRIRNVTATGFDVLVQKENAQTYTVPTENLSYLAIEYGTGTIDGRTIKVGITADKGVGTTSSTAATVNWGESFENPLFFAFMQTANDNYGATLRLINVSSGTPLSDTSAKFFKQTERSNSSLAAAQAETAAWLVIGESNVVGLENTMLEKQEYVIYPNPTMDKLFFDNNGQMLKVQIYALTGDKLMDMITNANEIDVRHLNKGEYLLNIEGKTQKFIKN